MMFHVGQMVVAAKSDESEAYRRYTLERRFKWPAGCERLQVGRVYTIRGFETTGGGLGIYLEEIVNPIGPAGYEWSYNRHSFRPVKETSIEIFRRLVAPIEGEKVRA
jgi:hypothetical protein